MKVFEHLDALPDLEGSVLTIGNFDGFHLGHRAILGVLTSRARDLGLPVAAITFEPHPLSLIAPERAPLPISTPGQRVRLLGEAGVDVLLVQRFDRAFSRLSPSEFITRYLIGAFQARLLAVGHNFRFGFEHRGTIDTLREWPSSFEVIEVPPVLYEGRPVSSSRIRRAVAAGDVIAARHQLGQCYEIEGSAVAGSGRGRSQTVPTLNLKPENRLLPRPGVYLTQLALGPPPDVWLGALTNVGTRPTFDGTDLTIETHVPDHEISAPDGPVRLRFLHRLRDEQRFDGADRLREQILRDIESARRFFDRLGRASGPDQIPVLENSHPASGHDG